MQGTACGCDMVGAITWGYIDRRVQRCGVLAILVRVRRGC